METGPKRQTPSRRLRDFRSALTLCEESAHLLPLLCPGIVSKSPHEVKDQKKARRFCSAGPVIHASGTVTAGTFPLFSCVVLPASAGHFRATLRAFSMLPEAEWP